MLVLWNGKLVSKEQVTISIDDRGYYFGDGVYEVFRIYDGRLFEKTAHLERLKRSAAEIRLTLPWSLEELDGQVKQLMSASDVTEGTLYLQVTRGEAVRAHPFPANADPVTVAYCKPAGRPVESMQDGIDAVTVEDIRWHRCDIKSLNLLPNTMAKQSALDAGAAEAILHRSGRVTECSASNFMMVKNGAIYTHPANNWILHGVTRSFVLGLADRLGIEVVEQPFDLAELRTAEEAFITGTTVEVTPIVLIDGSPVLSGQPGPITRRLQQAFAEAIGR